MGEVRREQAFTHKEIDKRREFAHRLQTRDAHQIRLQESL
ncbi:hypothetical protein J2S19_002607 [Metabacillus malikii]|uniref:Uncharacterized protein n=1 Tax=Metabacillus malikii TaxID=1504265 RepID=A0ABT9ZGB1_9BACI|nr:hypothetical protein [Metabacillus malikii]